MKMVEIKLRSVSAELEKLNTRKEKAEKRLQKATEKAEKLNANFPTVEAYRAWMDTVRTDELGFILDKADINRNGAYRDMGMAQWDLDDINDRIAKAEARVEKAQVDVDTYHAEMQAKLDHEAFEKLMAAEFEKEQKEWAKDGIKLEGRYYGESPTGKRFFIEGNHGFTERSRHCFTLTIGGQTIFTSGEFWRCYATIKNN